MSASVLCVELALWFCLSSWRFRWDRQLYQLTCPKEFLGCLIKVCSFYDRRNPVYPASLFPRAHPDRRTFLIVGLIAAIRRVLILTAEFSKPTEISEATFHNVMFELGLLTVLILPLVFSLFLLKRAFLVPTAP